MYLLIEVFEFAAGVPQEELAFDPDGEAEDVGEEQSRVERDALKVAVEDEAAPRSEEEELIAQPEPKCEKDQRSDEDGIGDQSVPFLPRRVGGLVRGKRRGVSLSGKR